MDASWQGGNEQNMKLGRKDGSDVFIDCISSNALQDFAWIALRRYSIRR